MIVWLARKDGGDPTDDAHIEAVKGARDVYLTDANGERIDWEWIGLVNSRLMVSFIPGVNQNGFTLYWPGNRAINLEE